MKINNFSKSMLVLALVAASSAAVAKDASFNSRMTLIKPITLSLVQDLSFATQIAGTAASVVTAPGDATAAVFSAQGEPSTTAQASIVETSINMITGTGASADEIIVVDSWTYGGSLDATGAVAFDTYGDITNMRVGGTANVSATDIPGDYVGTATFRLVYQ